MSKSNNRERIRDEEETPHKRAPALTLENLPSDILIEMFLALEHGSQFDALRQTSNRFKKLADRATIIRMQRAETINSDGTYVYKGKLYGIQIHLGEVRRWFASERHGVQKVRFENRQQMGELNYKDGKKDGVQKIWYDNGQQWFEENYKGGKKDGVQKAWYENENEQLHYELNFEDGKEDGVQKWWDENGNLLNEEIWKDGVKQ